MIGVYGKLSCCDEYSLLYTSISTCHAVPLNHLDECIRQSMLTNLTHRPLRSDDHISSLSQTVIHCGERQSVDDRTSLAWEEVFNPGPM